MNTTHTNKEASGAGQEPLVVESDLTIYQAPEAKRWLLDALAAVAVGGALELDLSQVAEIDTAGFQLLILLKRESARQGKSVRLAGHSASVLDLMNFYDVAAYFGDPVHIPAHDDSRG